MLCSLFHPSFSWERFISNKISRNSSLKTLNIKEKLWLTIYSIKIDSVIKTCIKIIMSCWIDLHYSLYYRYDSHCDMSGDQSGEVSWLFWPLPLSQLCQPEHKKLFNKKIPSNLECESSKQKTIFLPPR